MNDKIDKLTTLAEDNNRMLREIINYINIKESHANIENDNDFVRNIVANLVSTKINFNR